MKVLIPLLLSVAVRTLTSELSDSINNVNVEIVDHTLFLQQNTNNEVHSLEYWLQILGDEPDEGLELVDISDRQISNPQILGISEIQMNNEIEHKEQQEIQHSRLSKYVQLQQSEQDIQQIKQEQPQNIVKKEEINPLKLMLLYGEDANVKQNKQNQEITNEQILQQLKEEKVEKIEKMQSLIIQELKDKKPEKKKESSFLEKDYIEWEMKTLTNNNRVR